MKIIKIGMTAAMLGIVMSQAQAVELATQEQKYSYTMGTRVAKLLQAQNVSNVDAAVFAAGVSDVLSGKQLQMSNEEMSAAMKLHQEKLAKQRAEKGQAALEKGQAFLAENGKKTGIKTTESGLQYEVITEGKGESPKGEDKVKVHYRGTLVDGTQFDSSYDRGKPVTFGMKGVIPGFSEAISLMKPGGKSKAYIPSNLGYGERGAGSSIGPNETLIFEIELIEINPAAEAAK